MINPHLPCKKNQDKTILFHSIQKRDSTQPLHLRIQCRAHHFFRLLFFPLPWRRHILFHSKKVHCPRYLFCQDIHAVTTMIVPLLHFYQPPCTQSVHSANFCLQQCQDLTVLHNQDFLFSKKAYSNGRVLV